MSKTPYPMSSGDYFFYVLFSCSLFTLPFHNILILFPAFLLVLSQETPVPTLKPRHRQAGKPLEGTRKLQQGLWQQPCSQNTKHGRELFLGTFPALQPAWTASNEQRQERHRRWISTQHQIPPHTRVPPAAAHSNPPFNSSGYLKNQDKILSDPKGAITPSAASGSYAVTTQLRVPKGKIEEKPVLPSSLL